MLTGPALSKNKQDKGHCTESRLSHPAWLLRHMPQVVPGIATPGRYLPFLCLFITPDLIPQEGHSATLVEAMVSHHLRTEKPSCLNLLGSHACLSHVLI